MGRWLKGQLFNSCIRKMQGSQKDPVFPDEYIYIYIHIYTYIQLLSKRPFADLSPFLLGCMSYIVIVLPRNSADGRLQAVFVTPKFPQGGDSEHETRTPKHTEMLYIYCC